MMLGLSNNQLCWLRVGFGNSPILYVITIFSESPDFGYVLTDLLKIALLKSPLYLNCSVDHLDRINMRSKLSMYRRIVKLIE